MLGKLAGHSLPFLIKAVGLASQLVTVFVLLELLGIAEFGVYAASISLGIIIAVVTDLGFTRYSFRLLNRGAQLRPLLARSLFLRLIGSLLSIAFLAPFASRLGVPVLSISLAIMASSASQLANFHRYVALVRDKPRQSIMIEITGPVLYLFSIIIMFVGQKYFFISTTANTALFIYAGTYLLALIIWAYVLVLRTAWNQAITSLFYKRPPASAIFRTLNRSFPVGLEQLTSSLWYNMPVLLASGFGTTFDQAVCGIFQRIWNVAIAFISTALSTDIRRYYKKEKPLLLEIRGVAVQMALLFTLSLAIWSIYWIAYDRFLAPLAERSDLVLLLPSVVSAPVALCLSVTLLVGYIRLSFLALAFNERKIRSAASAAGVVTLLLTVATWEVFWPNSSASVLEECLMGFVLGHSIAGGLLLRTLLHRVSLGKRVL